LLSVFLHRINKLSVVLRFVLGRAKLVEV